MSCCPQSTKVESKMQGVFKPPVSGSEDKIRRRVYKRERLSETFDPSESLPKQSRIHTAQKTPAHGLIMPTFYTSEPERAGTGSQKRLERTGSVGQGSNESDSAESTEIKFSKNLSIERILPTTPHLPQALLSTSTQHQGTSSQFFV